MNKKLRIIVIVAILTFLILLISGIYLVTNKDKKPSTSLPSQTTTETTPKQTETTTPSIAPSGSSQQKTTTGTNATPLPPPPDPKKPWFNLELTQANQVGNQVVIRADVKGTTKGSCELEVTKAGAPTITQIANIGLDNDRDTDKLETKAICRGFNIPAHQFFIGGTWKVKIVAKVGDVTSEPLETKIDIRR